MAKFADCEAWDDSIGSAALKLLAIRVSQAGDHYFGRRRSSEQEIHQRRICAARQANARNKAINAEARNEATRMQRVGKVLHSALCIHEFVRTPKLQSSRIPNYVVQNPNLTTESVSSAEPTLLPS
ncbi:hypothetical protein N7510_010045 [Penicillium lagena]|uniref:uncharacterized protein n=1 Tax=Penicillium lagena TaxID=94218 RepID=UPI0025422B2F|nr:uncharacterized protein N7510_010045 [Penicillium lagena]KAJ5604891.1 hypothetical protein N7510_010045 [Penicillium lagena]